MKKNTSVKRIKALPNLLVRLKKCDEVINSKRQDFPNNSQKQQLDKLKMTEKIGKSNECANCMVVFEEKIRKISAISAKNKNQQDIPLPIKEALAFTFESSGKENVQMENSTFLKDSTQFFLCLTCAQSLNKLFRAFKDFTLLGKDNSLISLKLKELRECNTSNEDIEGSISSDIGIKEEVEVYEVDSCASDNEVSFEKSAVNLELDTGTTKLLGKSSHCFKNKRNNVHTDNLTEEQNERQTRLKTHLKSIANKYESSSKKSTTNTEPDTIMKAIVEKSSNSIKGGLKAVNIGRSRKQGEEHLKFSKRGMSFQAGKRFDVAIKHKLNCSHCSARFSDNVRKIAAISVEGENEKNTPVPIREALGFIFESVDSTAFFKKEVFGFLNTKYALPFFLCLDCALSLGKLYKKFQYFLDCQVSYSEIRGKVKLLRVHNYNNALSGNGPTGANCSNCAVRFDSKNKKISAISVSDKKGNDSIPVPIKNALSCVLESKENNKIKSVFLNDSRKSEFFMCLDCAMGIGELYKAFMHFTGLGVFEAEISTQLRTLRQLNYRNTILKLQINTETHHSRSEQLSQPNKDTENISGNVKPQENKKTGPRTESNKVTEPNGKKNIAQHIDNDESETSDSVCTTDDETYKSEKRAKFVPPKEDSHSCTLCEKVYSRKSWLLSHILVRHTEKSMIRCSICQKFCESNTKLQMHMYSHNASEKAPFSCDPCNKNFSTEEQLQYHVHRFHRKEKKCNFCQKVFYTKGLLDKHVKKCKIQKFDSTCHICKTEFPSIDDTISHLETHNGQGPWECTACSKSFNMPTNFQEHAKFHFIEGQRVHCCSICGLRMKRLADLKYHEQSHDANCVLPFKCTHENCKLAFKWKSQLEYHQRRHLSNGRSFQCTIDNCGKSFLTASNLRSHKKVHSDLKTKVCDYCGKTFNNSGSLSSHIKNVHSKTAMPTT